jgi:hypothetical protein
MNKAEWTGVTFDENNVGSCNGCGSKEGFRQVMHMDCENDFTTIYRCDKCGNEITMTCKRTGDNKKLWEEET